MNLTSFVLSSFSLLIQQYADNYRAQDLSKTLKELEGDYGLPRIQEYDFIVVGAGTAGCLLAGRLSEKNYTVLLLEKGGDPPPPISNPKYHKEIHMQRAITDTYYSTPQDFITSGIKLSKPRIMPVQAGKLMGGSGSQNYLVYNRGSPFDYDNWAKLTNDSSWSYEYILQHFRRIENHRGFLLNESLRNEFHGTGGPFSIEAHGPGTPNLDMWLSAGKELGFDLEDVNGFQKESFSPMQTFSKGGIRESTYTAFVKPFESERQNLFVHRYSNVDKVLVDSSKRAYGVTYKRHGNPQIALARKEIILSAGTLASPFILMKSGIGPEKVLNEMRVPVVVDLPGVGENLQDHPMVDVNLKANSPPPMGDEEFMQMTKDFHRNILGKDTTGSFGPDDPKALCHIVSQRARKDGQSEWPDYQILLITDRLDESSIDAFITLMRQKSVGNLVINTKAFLNGETDESKLVRMDMQWFSDRTDFDVLIEAIQFFYDIVEGTDAFAARNFTLSVANYPLCSKYSPRSYGFWKCYITHRSRSIRHVGGTCKMGVDTDPSAVVDSKLRVFGVSGLRVVDASVQPVITNSNINAAVIAIAEKASQDILQEYGIKWLME